MNIRHKIVIAIVATIVAAPAFATEPIKIGAFLSTTGPISLLGDPEKKVLELYVEEINRAGGILGRKLDLIIYDDGGAADKSQVMAKRLLESDKVDIIIGGSSTATTMSAIPMIERSEVPFCSMGGAVVVTDPVRKWVFRTPQTDRMASEKIMADMKKRGITKIALLSEDAGFGKSGREQTLLIAPSMGIEIVADQAYSAKDPDTTAQLTKIKNTPGVQAIFNWGYGQGPAVVTKNVKQLDMGVPLYQSHGVASKEYIRLAGPAAEGVRLPASPLMVFDQLPSSDPQKMVVQGFKAKYEKAFNSEVSAFGGYAFDCLQIMTAAIQRAGSTDKTKVRNEIEKTSGYIGTAGSVTMSATDHTGLTLRDAFRMVEVKDGNWKMIE